MRVLPAQPTHFGLIGDVHAEDRLRCAATAWLREHGVERLTCTGDLADGDGELARCCRLLKAADALTVHGNHDRWLLEDSMRDLPGATRLDGLDRATRD